MPAGEAARMLRCVHDRILVIALLGMVVACGNATPGDAAAPVTSEAQAAPAAKGPKKEAKPRRERPLPNFAGRTLEGERLEVSSMLGKRLVVYFFNPEIKAATATTKAIGKISKLRGKYNFDILGVATGSDRETALSFAKENSIDFKVLDDSSAAIARRMGLRQPMALFGVDADGYIIFGIQQLMSHAPDAQRAIESQIREALRLPALASKSEPTLGNRPVAPLFTVDIMDSQERFDLAAHRGKAVILIFFLHTCSHCHKALTFYREALAELPADKRPTLIGIEITGRTGAVRRELKSKNLDFFPLAFDDDRLNPNKTPILKIDVGAVRRLLQHVTFCYRRETSASLQVFGDHRSHINRHIRRAALPAKGHDRDRRWLGDTLNIDHEFGAGLSTEQCEKKNKQFQIFQHVPHRSSLASITGGYSSLTICFYRTDSGLKVPVAETIYAPRPPPSA